jgi:protein-tyrosine-phosphatase
MVTEKILFVCKYNRFRSRVAERYLKKINPKIEVKSAGVIKGRPLSQNQIRLAKSEGVDISGNPRWLSSGLLNWSSIIIIVADDVPLELFNDKKFENRKIVWSTSDTDSDNTEEVIKTIKSIKSEVDKFNEELKSWKQ